MHRTHHTWRAQTLTRCGAVRQGGGVLSPQKPEVYYKEDGPEPPSDGRLLPVIYNPLSSAGVLSNADDKKQIIGKVHLRSGAAEEEEEEAAAAEEEEAEGGSQKLGVHKRSVPELACALACAVACALACALAFGTLPGRSVW